MFAGSKDLYDKVMSIKHEVPCLKEVFTFDHIEGATYWKDIFSKDQQHIDQVAVIKKTIPTSHVATFIYTSGTTGHPKGVMQTHGNVMRLFTATDDWYRFGTKDVFLNIAGGLRVDDPAIEVNWVAFKRVAENFHIPDAFFISKNNDIALCRTFFGDNFCQQFDSFFSCLGIL